VENRKIILKSRPVGAPANSDFELVSSPVNKPGNGEILCRTIYMSLDPYMRSRMNEGKSYVEPVAIGETMGGGTVGQVIESRFPDLHPGDIVLTYDGWQEYAVSEGKHAVKLDPSLAPVSTALGVLGMPGMTAYMGLLEIGRPQAGNTVVVSAASGAVGSVVGQIARMKGCRVVGIAGAQEKCDYVVDELGFDTCISHKTEELRQRMQLACPAGIDIYFENVGGKVLEAVIPLLSFQARIPVCGMISHYNDTAIPDAPNHLPGLMRAVLTQRVLIRGFIVTDFSHKRAQFLDDMSGWIRSGEIKYREDIVCGLEKAVDSFRGLLQGKNFGKLLVQLSENPGSG
jgi:NADPH-dependent curcumin reductase CurA